MITKLPLKSHHILFILSILPLSIAYISQYFFNLQPCDLCIYQRIPFFIILFLSIFSIFFIKNQKTSNFIKYFSIFLFFINIILSFYHIGVEKEFFQMPESCSGINFNNFSNSDKLLDEIMSKSAVKCNEPAFEIFGVSMAGMNFIYCILSIILIYPKCFKV